MTHRSSPCVEFFFLDAGGGHRSAATALRESTLEQFPDWRIDLVNLQEVLTRIDPIKLVTKKHKATDLYNEILKHDLPLATEPALRFMQTAIQVAGPVIRDILRQHWTITQPDLVVSLIPNFNRAMYLALRKVRPSAPFVTIMTDIADTPPHFWQEPQDQYLICGSAKALQQARSQHAYAPEKVILTSGMILKKKFYEPTDADTPQARRAIRIEMGLDPDLPTGLIMFGGNGSREARSIVRRLKKAKTKTQTIVLCGSNRPLFRALAKEPNCFPVGFTENVPRYMKLADFFIGKPGPGSLSEAVHMGLPVVIKHNRMTMPQEKYNATWIKENNLGIVLKNFGRIDKAIDIMLRPDSFEKLQFNLSQLHNRAVLKIPTLLNSMLQCSISC